MNKNFKENVLVQTKNFRFEKEIYFSETEPTSLIETKSRSIKQ